MNSSDLRSISCDNARAIEKFTDARVCELLLPQNQAIKTARHAEQIFKIKEIQLPDRLVEVVNLLQYYFK